jgi:hypothetical protein
MLIEIGKKYLRDENDPKSLIEVLNIKVRNGRTSIHCLHMYEEYGNDFHVDTENTLTWVRPPKRVWSK